MKKAYLILGITLLATSIFYLRAQAEDQIFEKKPSITGHKYVPGEIIVKFKPSIKEDKIATFNAKHHASVLYTSRLVGFKRLRIPRKKSMAEMLQIYNQNPDVEYAEPNYIAHAFWAPNDPHYQYQWHLHNEKYGGVNMEAAWDKATGSSEVIIAVIDTGVAYEDYTPPGQRGRKKRYYLAPDLTATSFTPGYDFVEEDEHPNDAEGHGTHVTGTIAQSTNNGIGVAGVAFNCSIMPVKVLDSNGSGTYTDVAEGIIFAADNGAHVINLSLGGPDDSITLKNAIAHAYSKNVTIICASGNNGSPDTVSFPAAYDEYCIAVGATRYDEKVAYYSNGGPSLDLTAPGGDLSVDQNSDGYADGVLQQTFSDTTDDWGYWFYQGTSMAAPHVSGVAALLISSGVAVTPDEIRDVLQFTAEDKGAPGWDPEYGYGIVNAYNALTYTGEPIPPVAKAGPDQSVVVGQLVTFDGSGSDGNIFSYDWDFGDGVEAIDSSAIITHMYLTPGTYEVALTVIDVYGYSDTDTALVTVTEEPDEEEPNEIEVFFDSFETGNLTNWRALKQEI